jgi:hypothetical protein
MLETIMLTGIIILDLDIIAFEIYHSLEIIYSVFLINSIMKMVTAYYFQKRCLKALNMNGYDNT